MNLAAKIIGKIFSNTDPEKKAKLVDSLGGAIDRIFTSKNELKEIEMNLDLEMEKQVTQRHANDMQSDNENSKNIRPNIAKISIVITIVFTALDSITAIDFDVPDHWVKLWVSVLLTIVGFYFAGRSAEKIMKIWASTKK